MKSRPLEEMKRHASFKIPYLPFFPLPSLPSRFLTSSDALSLDSDHDMWVSVWLGSASHE